MNQVIESLPIRSMTDGERTIVLSLDMSLILTEMFIFHCVLFGRLA
jgi:hypothetical protein